MNRLIKAYIAIILISTISILYYSDRFKYEQGIINLEKSENSQEIFISSPYAFQESAYDAITILLEKYNSNIFYTHVKTIINKNFYTKYVYLTDRSYEHKIRLQEGRFFTQDEFNSGKYISTNKIQNDLQVGKIPGFGKNNILIIKPLYAVLDDRIALNGTFTLVMEDLNDLNNFLEDMNEIPSLKAHKKDLTNSSLYKFPFEILIFLEYIMLIIFILYEIIYSYSKIAIKKLNGYSALSIWYEYIKNIIVFQVVASLIVAITGFYILFGEVNVNSIQFLVKILKMYIFEIASSFYIISLPFLYLKNIKTTDLLKKMKKERSVFTFNIVFKFILSTVILIVFSNSFNSYQMSLARYNESYGLWEKANQYYIIPAASNITGEYFFSEQYKAKQKKLYTILNADGSILADFGFHLDIYDEDFKHREAFEREATVNPNYLIINDVYDIEGEKVLIKETEYDYIVLVNEKFIPKKQELLEYLQDIKKGDEEKIANQNIKVIWVKDKQSLFTYNFSINIAKGNLIDLNIIRVLTLENGANSDYDKIIAYQGNPLKIFIEKDIEIHDYLMPKLESLGLSEHVTEIYSLYDIVEAEIYNAKRIIMFQIVGMLFMMACIIMCIYQNIHLYIKNNLKTIFVKTINGYSFIYKFYKYYVYQSVSWLALVGLLIFLSKINSLETFNINNIAICTAIIFFIEFLMSYICFRIVERLNIARFLRGEE